MQTEVSFSSESNFYTGYLDNISDGGIFIATYDDLPIGSYLRIEFSLPDQQAPIAALGEVRWQRADNPKSDAPPGLGLRFVELPAGAQDRIEAFVRHRGTLFYDE